MRIERQAVIWALLLLVVATALVALRSVLLPFVLGMIIAYALNPLVERLARIGLPRAVASLIVVVFFLVVIGVAVVFLGPPLVSQAQHLAEALPSAAGRLRGVIEAFAAERLGSRFEEFRQGLDTAIAGLRVDWGAVVPAVMRSAWSHGLAAINLVSLILITPIVVFYLLLDWHPMLARIDGWLPRRSAPTIRRLASQIDAAIGAFIRGQGLVCIILGAFYALALSWAGLRYGLLIGLATGALSFVPFIGWITGLVVSSGMILAQAWPDLVPFYKVVGVFLAAQALDAAFLSPRIVGERVGLHPLWLIFALFVFSYLLGMVGVLIAVPLAAAVGVLVRYGLEVYLASDLYHGAATGHRDPLAPSAPAATMPAATSGLSPVATPRQPSEPAP